MNDERNAFVHLQCHSNQQCERANVEMTENNQVDRCRAALHCSYAHDEPQDTELRDKILESLDTIDQCFKKYGSDHIAISFNGGKDCNVMLHLLFLYAQRQGWPDGLQRVLSLYWSTTDVFDEVTENMQLCVQVYNLNVVTYDVTFRDGLRRAVDERKVEAIFMGQRSTDPHAESLKAFSPTTNGWPEVMRVNPLLQWTYADIWKFTRVERVPVCELYRRGFTSLGCTKSTKPNPLLSVDGTKFSPAWRLQDASQERAGRAKKSK